MEQHIPAWLDDAVLAAGLCTIYNEHDWDRCAGTPRPIPDRSQSEPDTPFLN